VHHDAVLGFERNRPSFFDGFSSFGLVLGRTVSGAREVSDSGYVMGAFTDASDPEHMRVYFFRARVRGPEDPVLCL